MIPFSDWRNQECSGFLNFLLRSGRVEPNPKMRADLQCSVRVAKQCGVLCDHLCCTAGGIILPVLNVFDRPVPGLAQWERRLPEN